MVLFLLLFLVVVVCFGLGFIVCFVWVFFVLFLVKPWSVFSEASLHLFFHVLNGIGSCTEFSVSIPI